ncbi:DNA-3-methyladenine glycosylase II [Fontibacillus phaseoli]|uniref:DNA-3-methyladenine glycosylase II n=1 Tax=Fontibacillus phaseoli TaxID=1416533 RepID=A0A369BDT6_9BACL|nr:DNA-3-methyladenine glycosylase [Fontibacillus phaseoli]RCX19713.1 DNA-3-methyladenine glycosylase II [Fontibacillus phaseoli]
MCAVATKTFEYGQKEIDGLSAADPVLGDYILRRGKVERVIIPELFPALVHAIVGQLISVKAVKTIWNRMQAAFGDISPERLAASSADDIQRCGMTMKKALCIHQIATQVASGEFDLEGLRHLPEAEVTARMTALPGIGVWTAEMLLMNCLERSDILSWGDIAIRRGIMNLYGLPDLSKEQFEQYRLRYSPYGSVASIYLWEISFRQADADGAGTPN